MHYIRNYGIQLPILERMVHNFISERFSKNHLQKMRFKISQLKLYMLFLKSVHCLVCNFQVKIVKIQTVYKLFVVKLRFNTKKKSNCYVDTVMAVLGSLCEVKVIKLFLKFTSIILLVDSLCLL